MVQGYYDYQSIWNNSLADGDLLREQETGHSHNLQAVHVAIKKTIDGTLQVVGHVLRKYLQFVRYS